MKGKIFKPTGPRTRWVLAADSAPSDNNVNDDEGVLAAVKTETNFEDQFRAMVAHLQPPEDEVPVIVNLIGNDISVAISARLPRSEIGFYGSSTLGSVTTTSDLKISLKTERINDLGPMVTLEIVKTCLKTRDTFAGISIISNIKAPMLHCVHVKTNVTCYIGIMNRHTMAGNDLMKYYLSVNEKLRFLIVFIRHWLRDVCPPDVGFTGYVITLLVVFYLQQEPYHLHSVSKLQMKARAESFKGWNLSFAPLDYEEDFEDVSMFDLLNGFFEFYANFDFFNDIVCIFFGQPIRKTGFVRPFHLPPIYERLERRKEIKEMCSGLCIQDPFEHDNDVAFITPKYASRFAILCFSGTRTMVEDQNIIESLLLKSRNKTWDKFQFEVPKIPSDFDKDSWRILVKVCLMNILKKILKFRVDEDISLQGNFIFKCSGSHIVWENRTQHLKQILPAQETNMLNEIQVTEKVATDCGSQLKLFIDVSLDITPIEAQIKMNSRGDNATITETYFYTMLKLPMFLNDEIESQIGETFSEEDELDMSKVKEEVDQTSASIKDDLSDVPDDFFDDFSNEDFLDGLEICETEPPVVDLVNHPPIRSKRERSPSRESGEYSSGSEKIVKKKKRTKESKKVKVNPYFQAAGPMIPIEPPRPVRPPVRFERYPRPFPRMFRPRGPFQPRGGFQPPFMPGFQRPPMHFRPRFEVPLPPGIDQVELPGKTHNMPRDRQFNDVKMVNDYVAPVVPRARPPPEIPLPPEKQEKVSRCTDAINFLFPNSKFSLVKRSTEVQFPVTLRNPMKNPLVFPFTTPQTPNSRTYSVALSDVLQKIGRMPDSIEPGGEFPQDEEYLKQVIFNTNPQVAKECQRCKLVAELDGVEAKMNIVRDYVDAEDANVGYLHGLKRKFDEAMVNLMETASSLEFGQEEPCEECHKRKKTPDVARIEFVELGVQTGDAEEESEEHGMPAVEDFQIPAAIKDVEDVKQEPGEIIEDPTFEESLEAALRIKSEPENTHFVQNPLVFKKNAKKKKRNLVCKEEHHQQNNGPLDNEATYVYTHNVCYDYYQNYSFATSIGR